MIGLKTQFKRKLPRHRRNCCVVKICWEKHRREWARLQLIGTAQSVPARTFAMMLIVSERAASFLRSCCISWLGQRTLRDRTASSWTYWSVAATSVMVIFVSGQAAAVPASPLFIPPRSSPLILCKYSHKFCWFLQTLFRWEHSSSSNQCQELLSNCCATNCESTRSGLLLLLAPVSYVDCTSIISFPFNIFQTFVVVWRHIFLPSVEINQGNSFTSLTYSYQILFYSCRK